MIICIDVTHKLRLVPWANCGGYVLFLDVVVRRYVDKKPYMFTWIRGCYLCVDKAW